MHAVLLTVLAIAGGDGGYSMTDPSVAPAGYHGGCDACGGNRARGNYHRNMPQTCYNPKYGCYGADRQMNRYPAFHGTYYRRPYNYRNVFDYPWHAELHEPSSFFAYNVQTPRPQQPMPQPGAGGGAVQHPYVPVPMAASAEQGNTLTTPTLRTLRR